MARGDRREPPSALCVRRTASGLAFGLMPALALGLALVATAASAAPKGRDACYADEATDEQTIAGCTLVIGQRKRESKESVRNAFFNRGTAYRSLGKNDRAITDFSEAIRIDPDYAAAYRRRGSTYDDIADYDAALADLDRAIRIEPDDATAFITRGIVYANKDMPARAVEDLGEAIRLDPARGLTRYSRALSLEKLGEFDRALADAEEAARLDTTDEDIPVLLKRLRAQRAARVTAGLAAKVLAPPTTAPQAAPQAAPQTAPTPQAALQAAPAVKPAPALDPAEARLAAYAWGLLARDAVARCDVATTAKQRAGLDAKLASLAPEMATAEPGLRARFDGRAEGCPAVEASASLGARLASFADLSPEAFAAEMQRRSP